ncbi:hypothetical protein TCE0_047r17968 [Talaromyces pinophilus]|uniref:Uncharacterized protein n=1 Tax=Talaromyces pinophilus TaxID=128442 RepID=A0A0B8N264_TALPI|nr:hypothetical protein TCE0_047r17968 [Talaromyces pinophilus]
MHPDTDPRKLVEAFEKATQKLNLCPNRVWAVAKENLPGLLPDGKPIPGHEGHDLCTFDFCEYSQRDFTAVEQRHECKEKEQCLRLQGLFPRDTLEEAANTGKSTVWSLDGKSMVEPPVPFMAVSHVWSDGTGTGAWPGGEVNRCLYTFFEDIATQFQCDGIWWDTICIPKEKAARTKAIQKIQRNYQDARITLVHDCFLRNWEWVDAEAACFAILMSPWFSRGWTALELAKSRKVKVVFRGPCGPLIKDLDEQILAKDTTTDAPPGPHKIATSIIRNLRDGVKTLNGLLTVLGSRSTSWPKDRAVISGLLLGVEVAHKNPQQDIWQQDIYKSILKKIGKVSPGHLFHNSATMCKGFSWCPTSLFNMPATDMEASLRVTQGLDLVGKWRIIPVESISSEKYVWNCTHPLIKKQIELHLQNPDSCVLLAECGTESVDRALLAKAMVKERSLATLYYRYIGAVHFHPALTGEEVNGDTDTWHETEVTLLGDAEGTAETDRKAWQLVTEMSREKSAEQSHQSDRDGAKGRECRTDPNAQAANEEDQAHEESEILPLILATSRPDENPDRELLQTPGSLQRTALHDAIWRGHHGLFSELIGKASLNVPDELGQQPLHLAAERGDKVIVSSLLERKANLGARCRYGQTALHRAAWGGSAVVVDLLLMAGSNVNTEDNDGNTALHIAVEKGFEPVVELLIENGAEVNARSQNDVTPLHHASMTGHKGFIELLVREGADVKAEDKSGWTPLHFAAENGRLAAMQSLLDSGADVNAKNKVGWTPLHGAVVKGYEEIIKVLINNSAEINVWDREGWTPLRFAAMSGHQPIVKLLADNGAVFETGNSEISWTPLHCVAMNGQWAVARKMLDNGCDINTTSKASEGWTPLRFAVENGQEAVVKLLVGANVNTKDVSNQTPLHWAAEKGQQAVVKLLIDKGASVNAKDSDDRTPLHYAAEKGHTGVVILLLNKGAGINTKAKHDQTPLHRAAEKGHHAVVKLLVDRGVDINAEDSDRRTPLHCAAEKGHTGVVKLLVDKGADVMATERKEFWTPLHFAAERDHDGVARLLVGAGANVNAAAYPRRENNEARTPLECAAESGHESIVKLLLDNGATVWQIGSYLSRTALHYAAEKGYEGIVKLLVDNGADINEMYGYDRRTALLGALINGHDGTMKLLLDKGADTNKGKWDNLSPLGWAAMTGNEAVVDILVDKGANINYRTPFDSLPLQLAAMYGHMAVVKMLVDKGADVNAKDHGDRTALHHGAIHGQEEVIKLLIDKGACINAKDNHDLTALHWGAMNGYEKVIKPLVSNGAATEIKSKREGWTPLHYSAIEGHQEVVKQLVGNGADVNAKDKVGWTPLHFAAREGGQAVVQLLVDNYADVNAKVMDGCDWATLRDGPVIGGQYYQDDKDKARKGWTPLHFAAEKGHEGIIRLLVSKGASIQAKDGRGYTPLHWATKNGHDGAVAVLVTKAAEMPKDKKSWISLLWGVAGETNP